MGNLKIDRFKKEGNFIVLGNNLMRDARLSLKARALMAVVLGLPDEWDFSVAGIAKVAGEGESSVRSALAELAEFGYYKTTRQKDANGKISKSEHYFCENPHVEEVREEEPHEEIPHEENPHVEIPHVENHQQLIINKSNIKESNINQSNINQSRIEGHVPNHRIRHCEESSDVAIRPGLLPFARNDESDARIDGKEDGSIDEALEIVEMVLASEQTAYTIGSKQLPKAQVQMRLKSLSRETIGIVMDNLRRNGGLNGVNNRRAYLISCLYNAAINPPRAVPAKTVKKSPFQNYSTARQKRDWEQLEWMERKLLEAKIAKLAN